MSARKVTLKTQKLLMALSGNECASPACKSKLVASDGVTLLGQICHICADKPGGARFDLNMTEEQRSDMANLIVLCRDCHAMVDNPDNTDKYPVELLTYWKHEHEAKNTDVAISRNPSLLATAVKAIADMPDENEAYVQEPSMSAFRIEDKISYNGIKRNEQMIQNYKVYYSRLNTIYATLEKEGSFAKDKLLRHVKGIYLKVKGECIGGRPDSYTALQENADYILEKVVQKLRESITDNDGFEEDIVFAVWVIVVDAFVKCKIMEAPQK